jgi:polyisoprenyl-phosphate glycosyltransferase
MLLSIVIPVYRAEDIVDELIKRIKASVSSITVNEYEIILIEDGSADNTWKLIENKCKSESSIVAIKLSRNFGQHHAITAGLDFCKGDWVVVMDCDLQDRPEEIPRLFQKATEEGFDIVFAKRNSRTDSFIKKVFSRFFFWAFSYLTGIKYDSTIANFGIYNTKVIDAIKSMKEPMRAFFPMTQWVGFSKGAIDVVHGERFSGKSTYRFGDLIKLASDIILSYSDKPLKIIIRLGFMISLFSFVAAIYTLIKYFNNEIVVSGYTSIFISIWFLGGLIIFILGVIGLYISRIFAGVKNRPFYIVDKRINA